ncbi:MAG: sigma-70 family RNA polymerase sigma factor [Gammaproteobacteria bacterium]|nr:sigma-70 family RNA polymerase sigma factor [Gammaproteobacteria bacterium]
MAAFADIELDPQTTMGLQRGDRTAQADAYRLLAPAILGLAQRILQDRGLAQEVLQDTFVELLEQAGKLRSAEAVVGWLRKVAVNHCLMRLRSPWHKRRTSTFVEEAEDHVSSSQRMEGLSDVERALASLGPETRLVVWLHDVEGYTHKEIASLTGHKPSYSKSQLARGYAKLLGEFGGSYEKATVSHIRPACTS